LRAAEPARKFVHPAVNVALADKRRIFLVGERLIRRAGALRRRLCLGGDDFFVFFLILFAAFTRLIFCAFVWLLRERCGGKRAERALC
jgi:hypothetical protein